MGELKPGEWVVIELVGIARERYYAAAEIKRVTPKTVFADAHYTMRHDRRLCTPMPDAETAKKVAAQLTSAGAEKNRRKREADTYYKRESERLLSPYRIVEPSDD